MGIGAGSEVGADTSDEVAAASDELGASSDEDGIASEVEVGTTTPVLVELTDGSATADEER